MRTEKVVRCGGEYAREEDWLYFIDVDGDISRTKLPKKQQKKRKKKDERRSV